MFKNYVQKKLEKLVRQYFAVHHPRLVVVVGSVGKTTTKVAIATVLNEGGLRVRMEKNNHNTEMSVPPALLGVEYPVGKTHSPIAWLKVFRAMKHRIKAEADVDVIVQELGTDGIGQIPHFGSYLNADIAVVTAITPEHMEYFGRIEEVAREELSVGAFSNITMINGEDVDARFAPLLPSKRVVTYGLDSNNNYSFEFQSTNPLEGFSGNFISPELGKVPAKINFIGEHSLRSAVAAGAVAAKLGLSAEQISRGLNEIKAVPGRMNLLRGENNTLIIDDTYNSSPAAAIAALNTLYKVDSPQRIAILGSMNELGAESAEYHRQVGEACDPIALECVVTIGEEANKYLAPAAKAKNNRVRSFAGPIEAGMFVSRLLRPGAVVLAKGSQNGVFAEEAVKVLLHSSGDEHKLVRQSLEWQEIKRKIYDE